MVNKVRRRMQEMRFATEGVTLSGSLFQKGEDCMQMTIRRSPPKKAGAEGATPA